MTDRLQPVTPAEVVSEYTGLSEERLTELGGVSGWVVDPRPVSPALTDTFASPGYDATIPHEHDHIRDWASFGELAGPDGLKALMKAVR